MVRVVWRGEGVVMCGEGGEGVVMCGEGGVGKVWW